MNRTVAIIAIAAISLTAACDRPGPRELPARSEHEQQQVPGALRGTVTYTDGRPVAEVMVTATSTDDPQRPVPELAVMTDSKGRYEWPLAPGRYRLTVEVPGAGKVEGYTELTADGGLLDLTLG